MKGRYLISMSILTGLVMLLAGCGDEPRDMQTEDSPDQQAQQARASAGSERVMGHVRWYDREVVLSNVQCTERDGRWNYSASNNELRFSGWRSQSEPEHAATARTVVQLRIQRDDEPTLSFHMMDNQQINGERMLQDVEAGAHGIAGKTHMIAANTPTGDEYPYPEGIMVEFELNCP